MLRWLSNHTYGSGRARAGLPEGLTVWPVSGSVRRGWGCVRLGGVPGAGPRESHWRSSSAENRAALCMLRAGWDDPLVLRLPRPAPLEAASQSSARSVRGRLNFEGSSRVGRGGGRISAESSETRRASWSAPVAATLGPQDPMAEEAQVNGKGPGSE